MGVFNIRLREDSSLEIMGRVTARTATGALTGEPGEGKWLKQADVSTIERKIFDLDGDDPATPIDTDSLTVSSVIVDTPIVPGSGNDDGAWTVDDVGYNFRDSDLTAPFTSAEHRYRIEYKVTLSGGFIFFGVYEGNTESITGS